MEPSNPEQEPQESWVNRLETRKTWKEEVKDLRYVWLAIAAIVATGNIPSAILAFALGSKGEATGLWDFYKGTFPFTTSIAIIAFLAFIGFFTDESWVTETPDHGCLTRVGTWAIILLAATWLGNALGNNKVTVGAIFQQMNA